MKVKEHSEGVAADRRPCGRGKAPTATKTAATGGARAWPGATMSRGRLARAYP